jgi:hypothetical protein
MRPKLHSIDESLAPAAKIADRTVEVVNSVEFFRCSQFVPKRMCSSRRHRKLISGLAEHHPDDLNEPLA